MEAEQPPIQDCKSRSIDLTAPGVATRPTTTSPSSRRSSKNAATPTLTHKPHPVGHSLGSIIARNSSTPFGLAWSLPNSALAHGASLPNKPRKSRFTEDFGDLNPAQVKEVEMLARFPGPAEKLQGRAEAGAHTSAPSGGLGNVKARVKFEKLDECCEV